MGQSSQDDIDAMLGDLDAASDNSEDSSQLGDTQSNASASVDQNTAESESIQEKDLSSDQSHQQTGEDSDEPQSGMQPWVDFIPEEERPIPQNVPEYIQRTEDDGNYAMREAELLKIYYINHRNSVHPSYYELWNETSNTEFKRMVLLEMRKKTAIEREKRLALEQESSGEVNNSDADSTYEPDSEGS